MESDTVQRGFYVADPLLGWDGLHLPNLLCHIEFRVF